MGGRIVSSKTAKIAEKDREWYYSELMSEGCLCGKPKKRKYSFCPRCYYSLPRHMREDLYQLIGDGYEEAFEAAVAWLY